MCVREKERGNVKKIHVNIKVHMEKHEQGCTSGVIPAPERCGGAVEAAPSVG